MKAHPPYSIIHVPLHEQLSSPVPDIGKEGRYVVFWWKDYALGDFYLEPEKNLLAKKYGHELIKIIEPAILFYSQNSHFIASNWKQYLLDQDLEQWNAFMEQVFSAYSSSVVPERVPLSVIICTHGRPAQLQKCLEVLRNLSCTAEEIIVVDNAPKDELSKEVVQQFKGVVYVKESRKGLDIARNTGIRHARCAVVAFVDDDVLVHPLWAYRTWEGFKNPAVAAMTGLVIASELNSEAQFIFEKHWSFNRGYTDKFYDNVYFHKTLLKGPPVWEIGAGANMAFRKAIFEEVGYFNELLDAGAAGCSGDSEMWYRILAYGHSIHYCPRAIAYHEHRKELKGFKKQIFYYMRGFTTAALVQQQQHPEAGYYKRLFWNLPQQFVRMAASGFPHYRYRYTTIWVEIMGVLSGLLYYYKNKSYHSKLSR